MRRRRLLLGVGALALLGMVGFGLFLWVTNPPRVTLDNCRRLRQGMSVRDVEALLGEPNEVNKYAHCTFRVWRSEEAEIAVIFDTADQVWYRPSFWEHSFLDRIRRWLHL